MRCTYNPYNFAVILLKDWLPSLPLLLAQLLQAVVGHLRGLCYW